MVSFLDKQLFVFKNFIAFLEIWGMENYGSTDILWQPVYREVMCNTMLDFNDELEDTLYSGEYDSETFRDAVFAFIENKVLDGYPIWRLFKLSPWLDEKLEEQLHTSEYKRKSKLFKETKCFHCKYYYDRPVAFKETIDGTKTISYKDLSDDEKDSVLLHHVHRECTKRTELQNALTEYKRSNSPGGIHRGNVPIEFSYKKFNTEGFRARDKWFFDLANLHDCPYFEESNMTYDEFIKEYGRLE